MCVLSFIVSKWIIKVIIFNVAEITGVITKSMEAYSIDEELKRNVWKWLLEQVCP